MQMIELDFLKALCTAKQIVRSVSEGKKASFRDAFQKFNLYCSKSKKAIINDCHLHKVFPSSFVP